MLLLDLATMTRAACETWCKRAGLAAAVAVCAAALAVPSLAHAQAPAASAGDESAPTAAGQPAHDAAAGSERPAEHAPAQDTPPANDHGAPVPGAPAGAHGDAAQHGAEGAHAAGQAAAEGHTETHEASPWGLIGKIVNFAIVVGVVVYFARKPFAQYLADRGVQIRTDLVRAREMKEEAAQQIAAIDAKLKQLPTELDGLRERGRDEVSAEEARINEAAAQERVRLLEQTRREIDLQLRAARRELVTHAADLSVRVARERIRQRITNDDQARLVDRYLEQVRTND